MQEHKLLPCPFCEGAGIIIFLLDKIEVGCSVCRDAPRTTYLRSDIVKAFDDWNSWVRMVEDE